MNRDKKTFKLVVMAMFAAIIFILALTPLGFIRLPFINATTIHIPVIIGSILLGPKYGAALGFMFGLTSFIINTMTPNPMISFVFTPLYPVPGTTSGSAWALVVCFVPRILVGIVPWYVYKGMGKLLKNKFNVLSLTVAGIIGSMTNTLLVMHLILFLFREPYAEVRNLALDAVYGVIMGIIAMNGIPEAIVAGILTAAICIPLMMKMNVQAN